MLFGHDEGKNIKQLCNGEKDVVCIKMGGTGADTAAEARRNIFEGNPLPIKEGGTDATTAENARNNLGIGNIHYKTKKITDYQFTANQVRSITVPYPTLDGYTPIIISVYCTNKSVIRVFNAYISGNNIKFEAVSNSSATITDASFVMYLLYIKNTFLVNE